MTQKLNLEKGRAATLRDEHRQAITDLRSRLRNQYAERLKAVREERRGKEQKARAEYNERLERQRAKYEGRAKHDF